MPCPRPVVVYHCIETLLQSGLTASNSGPGPLSAFRFCLLSEETWSIPRQKRTSAKKYSDTAVTVTEASPAHHFHAYSPTGRRFRTMTPPIAVTDIDNGTTTVAGIENIALPEAGA